MFKLKNLFLLLITAVISLQIHAQVGINTASPNPQSALDVESITTPKKGVIIPRMTTGERDQIDPTALASSSQGLMIYNIDEDCFNYYDKNASKWDSMCGGASKAVFGPVNCGDATLHGRYFVGVPVASDDYLSIVLTVNTPGQYTITAKPQIDNGYSFSASGAVLATGTYTIILPASGTPKVSGLNIIAITINGTNLTQDCLLLPLTVEDVQPYYMFDCGTASITGTYFQDVPVTSTNTITLNITDEHVGSAGQAYTIKSYNTALPPTRADGKSGLYFIGTGKLTGTAPQTVVLQAYGYPESTDVPTKPITLYANNADDGTGYTPAFSTFCGPVSVPVKPAPTYTLVCATQVLGAGTYVTDIPLTATNTITMNISTSAADVAAGNTYSIKATESPTDGWAFKGTGLITTQPIQSVVLTAYGSAPTTPGVHHFTITTQNSTPQTTCAQDITVTAPFYTITGAPTVSAQVNGGVDNTNGGATNGAYVLRRVLDNTNTITLPINVTAGAGLTYVIHTDTQNGMSFSATGTLAAGAQNIVLKGTGTPTAVGPTTFTITTNSKATGTITTTVPVITVYPALKIMTLGDNGSYYPNNSLGNGFSAFLNTRSNFGGLMGSKYYQNGWIFVDNFDTGTTLDNDLKTKNPDIVVITWNWMDGPSGAYIRSYLQRGGIVLCTSQETSTYTFLNGVFNVANITQANGSLYGVYQFPSSLSSDPVINGDFGNLVNQFWGEDQSATQYFKNLPVNTTVYTTGNDVTGAAGLDPTATTAFRATDMDFFFFGDGGFVGSAAGGGAWEYLWNIGYPAWFDVNAQPVPHNGYGNGSNHAVSNSTFIANFMTWAANQVRTKNYPISGAK